MSTADKLSKLLETKEAIKQAIIDKGGTVGDVFADYPTAIQNIQGGGGSGTFVVPAGLKFAYSKVEEFPEDWDWSEIVQVTDASNFFYNCRSLTTVPKLKFNDLRNTSYMFSYTNITNIDVSEWNTSNLKTMNNMFDNSKLSAIPPIDFSNASDLSNVFNYCKITEANINTSSATKIDSLFNNCAALQTVSEIDTSNITSNISKYSSPFASCYLLRNFDGFKGLKVNIYLTDCYSLSYESLMNVINKLADGVSSKTLYLTQDSVNQLSDDDIAIATNKGWTISPAKTINEPVVVTSLSQVPSSTYNITPKTYDFSQYTGVWNSGGTSALKCDPYVFEADLYSTTDASYMFYGKSKLKYFDLQHTENVTNMSYMFYNLPWSTFPSQLDTQSVTNMEYMFKWNRNLTSIPLLNTTNVTSMSHMFETCSRLVNIPKFDTQNVTNMGQMFSGCGYLTSIPEFNTQNVTNMEQMFYGCTSLISIPKLDTQNVTNMKRMFYGCSSLISVHLTTQNVTDMESMFRDCYSLQSVTMVGGVPEGVNAYRSFENIATNGTFYYDSKYDYSKIIAELPATWTAVPLTE